MNKFLIIFMVAVFCYGCGLATHDIILIEYVGGAAK